MQKKYKKIILALLVLFLLGSLAWFIIFFRSQTGSNIIEQTRNNFPFGQINPGTVTPQTGNQGTIETDNTQETIDKEPEKTTIGPRLRRISDFPTGGFAPIIRIDDKEVTDISIDANGVSSQVTKTIQVENNYVRYSAIDDATLYDSQLTPSDITDERLTENYIPNAEHVYFSENGEHALFQYWNPDERLIETYLGNITKADLEIDACPYDFETPIELGDEGMHIFGIHKFLNTNRQTRIATQGINSPGNEGSLAIPATITAIKNFQSLHELDIDGKLGPATQAKMLSICNEQQGVIAEQKLENLEEKYNISGFFLPQKITALDINPTGKNFFYITEGNNNVTG
ncbi:MAG: peptidoglycan-binding domain-containing protein, partial [Minisyncoccia bacterium]